MSDRWFLTVTFILSPFDGRHIDEQTNHLHRHRRPSFVLNLKMKATDMPDVYEKKWKRSNDDHSKLIDKENKHFMRNDQKNDIRWSSVMLM